MTIDYRILTHMDEFEQAVDLEIAIWGVSPRDALPSHLLHMSSLNGGLCMGAYSDQRMVGMSFALPVRQGQRWVLWSYMTGVHPAYQRSGIGYHLKQHQREWAQQQGYRAVRWTFDPLQRGNANFNIRHLGAVSSVYHDNYYGKMTDSINAGLPSDRIEVEWKVTPPKARQRTRIDLDQVQFALKADESGKPLVAEIGAESSLSLLIEIPSDLPLLKTAQPDAALHWRMALRQVLHDAFERGYAVTDFAHIENRWCYVLTAPEVWYLYVVECADHSLYTGVTNRLERRIAQHNAGKGAAYTAARRPVVLRGAWRFPNRSAALKAEIRFKQQPRSDKIASLQAQAPYLGGVFVEKH